MLAHFIQRKGKGNLVVAVPLLISVVLFIAADVLSIDDRYLGAITLLLSAAILFYYDTRPAIIIEEGSLIRQVVKAPAERGRHQLMWIDMKYWALAMGIGGIAMLVNVSR